MSTSKIIALFVRCNPGIAAGAGEPANGNPRWYEDLNGNFFCGGGVREKNA